jgi:hypothetical protein
MRLAQLVGGRRDEAERTRIIDPDGRAVLAEERNGLVLFLTSRRRRPAAKAACSSGSPEVAEP